MFRLLLLVSLSACLGNVNAMAYPIPDPKSSFECSINRFINAWNRVKCSDSLPEYGVPKNYKEARHCLQLAIERAEHVSYRLNFEKDPEKIKELKIELGRFPYDKKRYENLVLRLWSMENRAR